MTKYLNVTFSSVFVFVFIPKLFATSGCVDKSNNLHLPLTELAPIVRSNFIPHNIMSITEEGNQQKELEKIIPIFKENIIFDKQATAYVCQDGVYKFPTTNAKVLLKSY